ncbi:MAG: DNA repair protein RadC [Bacteroidetes bacterium]|nr:DNA repair protein RadC [Bacteroidota bacterium]
MAFTSIKNWSEDDRPREKMLLKGKEALSYAELIAILINNGTQDQSALDVSRNLLNAVNNDLGKLSKMSVREILCLKIKGIGPAKAIAIAAALELGLRRDMHEKKINRITKSTDVAAYLKSRLQYKKQEVFAVLFLNRANKINHFEIVSEGGITGTVVDPRIIFKKALEYDAVNLILCHNHPSGNLRPSQADEDLTKKLSEAARHLDIYIIDHIIVSDEGHFSFADEGIM